ncbi:MAG: hypothetical protein U1F52_09330 [Burkholderiales bacterium]
MTMSVRRPPIGGCAGAPRIGRGITVTVRMRRVSPEGNAGLAEAVACGSTEAIVDPAALTVSADPAAPGSGVDTAAASRVAQ